MNRDGWWWCDAALTNRSIRRRIFWEMLIRRPALSRGASDQSARPA
jgi:hypothetical protein